MDELSPSNSINFYVCLRQKEEFGNYGHGHYDY